MDKTIRNAERYEDSLDEIQRLKCRAGQHLWDNGLILLGKITRRCWKCPATEEFLYHYEKVDEACPNEVHQDLPEIPEKVVKILQSPNLRHCEGCGMTWRVNGSET